MKINVEWWIAAGKNSAERLIDSAKSNPQLWIGIVFGTIIGILVAKLGR